MNIIEWIKNDWNNNRLTLIMELINMLGNILAAGYTAIAFPNVNFLLMYLFYSVASIAGIIFSIKRKTIPLLTLNIIFTIINIIGLIKSFY